MVIAIIDRKGQPDLCAGIVRKVLPSAACLITPSLADIWQTDAPVPPLSGVLLYGASEDLPPEEQETLSEMARRFPFASTDSAETSLEQWASRCAAFHPQFPRQPDRYPWGCSLMVHMPRARAPRMCAAGNVSLGGLYIQDPRSKPEVGDRLSLRFPLLGSQISASAVVQWVQSKQAASRSPGYGCQFVDTELWVRGVLVNAARKSQPPPITPPEDQGPPSSDP